MAKYGPGAQKKVEKVMRERKRGTLRSGSGRKVTSPKQAIAIGLSEARRDGAKVPPAPGRRSKASSTGGRKRTRKAAAKTSRKTAAKTTRKRKRTVSATRTSGARRSRRASR